jgi:hypothetical protein
MTTGAAADHQDAAKIKANVIDNGTMSAKKGYQLGRPWCMNG